MRTRSEIRARIEQKRRLHRSTLTDLQALRNGLHAQLRAEIEARDRRQRAARDDGQLSFDLEPKPAA